MILRAVFWLALVAVLAPHQPDVGFGPPKLPSIVPSKIAERMMQSTKVSPCSERTPCLGDFSLVGDIREAMIARLGRARDEIRAAERASPGLHLR